MPKERYFAQASISIQAGLLTALFMLYGCGSARVPDSAPPGSNPPPVDGNHAPTIGGVPPSAATVGIAYSFVPSADDADGDTLSFSITSRPSWANFSATTGALTGTPSAAGNYSGIVITADDGKADVSLSPFSIIVQAAIEPPPAQTCSAPIQGSRATHNVGGGANPHAELSTVPWLSLQAGDVVNIYHRAEPYRTNIALRAQGTASNPVIINGVTDSGCNRPIISGAGATNASDQASGYHSSNSGTYGLSTILIWWGTGNYGRKPSHITLQNLVISGGPSGIYAVTVEDLTVQDCEIYDTNGWGVFVNSKNQSAVETSYRTVIRNNRIYNNGISGSYLFHNLYIQSYGALYEGNYIGQLRSGGQGSSLKDRSSSTVVRYNHVDCALRCLDLVETEENMNILGQDPNYNDAWVYGNLFVNDHTKAAGSSTSLFHWGYDNHPDNARRGTLYFYNNTVVSINSRDSWFALFDQESSNYPIDPNNTVDLRNNIIWHRGSAQMAMAEKLGSINFNGTNWISSGWGNGDPWGGNSVQVNLLGTALEGTDPGLSGTYRPNAGSPAIGSGSSDTPTTVTFEPVNPVGTITRPSFLDLGAFEH